MQILPFFVIFVCDNNFILRPTWCKRISESIVCGVRSLHLAKKILNLTQLLRCLVFWWFIFWFELENRFLQFINSFFVAHYHFLHLDGACFGKKINEIIHFIFWSYLWFLKIFYLREVTIKTVHWVISNLHLAKLDLLSDFN